MSLEDLMESIKDSKKLSGSKGSNLAAILLKTARLLQSHNELVKTLYDEAERDLRTLR